MATNTMTLPKGFVLDEEPQQDIALPDGFVLDEEPQEPLQPEWDVPAGHTLVSSPIPQEELAQIEADKKRLQAEQAYTAKTPDQKWVQDKGYPVEFESLMKPIPDIIDRGANYGMSYGLTTSRKATPDETFQRNYDQLEPQDPLRQKVDRINALQETYSAAMTKIADSKKRKFKGFWDEMGRNIASSSLSVASGLSGTLADISDTAIWDKDKVLDLADWFYEKSKAKSIAPAAKAEGKWGRIRQFTASSIGQALPYMAASVASTALTGNPLGGFAVGFSVEGDNTKRAMLEAGASEEHAQLGKLIVGTINGAIETLQVSGVIKLAENGRGSLKFLVDAVRQKAWKRALQAGKQLTYKQLESFLGEAIEEALQETSSIVAEATVDASVLEEAPSRIFGAALGGGVAGIGLGFAGSIFSKRNKNSYSRKEYTELYGKGKSSLKERKEAFDFDRERYNEEMRKQGKSPTLGEQGISLDSIQRELDQTTEAETIPPISDMRVDYSGNAEDATQLAPEEEVGLESQTEPISDILVEQEVTVTEPTSIPEIKGKLTAEADTLMEEFGTAEGVQRAGEIADKLEQLNKEIEDIDNWQEKAVGKDPKWVAKKLGIKLENSADREMSGYQINGALDYYKAGLEGVDVSQVLDGNQNEIQVQAYEAGLAKFKPVVKPKITGKKVVAPQKVEFPVSGLKTEVAPAIEPKTQAPAKPRIKGKKVVVKPVVEEKPLVKTPVEAPVLEEKPVAVAKPVKTKIKGKKVKKPATVVETKPAEKPKIQAKKTQPKPAKETSKKTKTQSVIAKQIYSELVKEGEKADLDYEKMNIKEQVEKSMALVKSDPQTAKEITFGAINNTGINDNAIRLAYYSQLIEAGKFKEAAKAAQRVISMNTKAGKDVVMNKGFIDENSPIKFVKLVSERKMAEASKKPVLLEKNRTKSKAKSTRKRIKKEVTAAQKYMEKKKMNIANAAALIDSWTC